MKMDEKQLLETQKDALRSDLANFKKEVIDKIKRDEKFTFHYSEIGLYYGSRILDLVLTNNKNAKKKYDEYVKHYIAEESKIKEMQENVREKRVKLNLKHDRMTFETKLIREAYNKRDDDDEYEYSIYVDGKPVYTESNFSYRGRYTSNFDMISCTERALHEVSDLESRYEEVRKYKQLREQLKSMGEPSSLMEKFKVSKLEKEAKKLEKHGAVANYAKLYSSLDVLKAFAKEYKTGTLGTDTTIVQDEKAIKEAENNLHSERDKFVDNLNNLSYDILAIKYATIYKKNFDLLRMQKDGAKAALRRLVGNTEYYTDAAIDKVANNIDEVLLNYDIASALHDDYRKKFFNPATGTFTERWRPVKDVDFIKKYKNKQLPANLKLNGDNLEIDITNSSFDQLSLDWQAENYAAAKVAKQVAEKGYTADMAGVVGTIIHDDNWLIRNEYAKGSELDVPFAELTNVEKMKDLVQYAVAQRVIKEKQQKAEEKSII